MEKESHWLNGWGLSLLLITVTILLAIASLSPTAGRLTPFARAVNENSKVRQLLLSCRIYAKDNRGNYPPTLKSLYPDYVDHLPAFEGEDEKGKNKLPMIYYHGLTEESDPDTPVIEHPFTFEGEKIIGYISGHVTTKKPSEK